MNKLFSLITMALVAGGVVLGASSVQAEEKLVLQISDDNPRTMNIVLNNAMNVAKALGAGGVDIEIVAYGPGLQMVKKDSKLAEKMKQAYAFGNIKFSVCENTMKNLKWTNKDLLNEAFIQTGIVPSGVVRIMELQGEGYKYVRP